MDAVRSSKQSALEAMDASEQYGASNFNAASEEDPYISESSFFEDFEASRENYQFWIAIEDELYLSIGYEHFFDEVQSAKHELRLQHGGHRTQAASLLLRTIADNLINHVSHKTKLLETGRCYFENAQKAVNDYGPEDASGFDDEWFKLRNNLESAEQYLKSLETALPLCWASLREFTMLSRPERYLPGNLVKLIKDDDCANFNEAIAQKEKTSQALASNQWVDDWEDDIPF